MQKALPFLMSIFFAPIGCQETSASETYWCSNDAKLVVFDRHSGAHLAHKETVLENGEEKTYWVGCGFSRLIELPNEIFVPNKDKTMIMQGIGDHCSQGQLLLFNSETLNTLVINNRSFRVEEQLHCHRD